jgi:hypothetical protein
MRSYLQGEQFYRRSEWDSAGAAFSQAVADDSTFALAQYRLAMTYGWTGSANTPVAHAAGAAAVRFAGRLPPDEQSLIRAYHMFQEGRTEATDSMLRYTAANPEDADGWYLLGESQYHTRNRVGRSPAALRAPFERVLSIDSSLTPATIHPMELALEQNDTARYNRYLGILRQAGATDELARYRAAAAIAWGNLSADSAEIAKLEASPRMDAAMAGYLAILGRATDDPDSALARMSAAAALAPAGSAVGTQMPQMVAMTLSGLGRLSEANALATRFPQNEGGYLIGILPVISGFAPPGYADSVSARIRAQGLARPIEKMTNPFEFYFRSAFLLGQGDAAQAAPFIQRGLALDSAALARSGGRAARGLMLGIDGWRMIAQGDSARGLARIDSALAIIGLNFGGVVTAPLRLERALAMAGRPATRQAGIDLLRYGFTWDPEMQPVATLALARALEAAGDRPGAADAYGTFIRYWNKADPPLQPKVAEARAALARLKASGG